MNTADRKKLCLAREIVWSLDIGIAVTLLLAILRAAGIARRASDALLGAAWHLLPTDHLGKALANAVLVLASALAFSLLAFVAMRLRPGRKAGVSPRLTHAQRRRGVRVAMTTPVFVYGWIKGEPFSEMAETENGSPLGALVRLSTKVAVSQELILTNPRTEQDMTCRVARLAAQENGKTVVGVAFLLEAASFWGNEFAVGAPDAERRAD